MKNIDCCFIKENNWFRYRTGAFLINDKKILFVKTAFGTYHYVVGGAVHLGETSQTCIERELFEETGLHCQIDHLAVVCENFFTGNGGSMDGKDCQTIEFYYIVRTTDDINNVKSCTDDLERLVWIPIDKLNDVEIKPAFITKEFINKLLSNKEIVHIVQKPL